VRALRPGPDTPRILVAEDDPGIARFLELVVTRGGFAVDSVKDGADALQLLSGQEYDVLLLDLTLPRVNGWEVVAALRGFKRRPAVIVITASTRYVHELDPDLVTSIVRKPFDLSMLMSLVTETATAMARNRGAHIPARNNHPSDEIDVC
jgi:DNA-binding response OmpR family regulator